jgi:hypothetical protein
VTARASAILAALLLAGCAWSPDDSTVCRFYLKRIACRAAF